MSRSDKDRSIAASNSLVLFPIWFFGYYVAGEPLISHVHVLTVNFHI